MTTARWDIEAVRAAFPALALADNGKPRVYLDAPGGSEVPARVVERMSAVMLKSCANEGGAFRTSHDSDRIMVGAHAAAAAFLGAAPDEIVFGLNSTSLIFHFSRMVARDWRPGDEIVLTRMDHDGNVGAWIIAAEERGVFASGKWAWCGHKGARNPSVGQLNTAGAGMSCISSPRRAPASLAIAFPARCPRLCGRLPE